MRGFFRNCSNSASGHRIRNVGSASGLSLAEDDRLEAYPTGQTSLSTPSRLPLEDQQIVPLVGGHGGRAGAVATGDAPLEGVAGDFVDVHVGAAGLSTGGLLGVERSRLGVSSHGVGAAAQTTGGAVPAEFFARPIPDPSVHCSD